MDKLHYETDMLYGSAVSKTKCPYGREANVGSTLCQRCYDFDEMSKTQHWVSCRRHTQEKNIENMEKRKLW